MVGERGKISYSSTHNRVRLEVKGKIPYSYTHIRVMVEIECKIK